MLLLFGAIAQNIIGTPLEEGAGFWRFCHHLTGLVMWFSYLLPANLLAAIALAQANRSRRRQYRQAFQLQTEIDRRRAAQTRLAAANRRNLKLLYNALPRQVARHLRN